MSGQLSKERAKLQNHLDHISRVRQDAVITSDQITAIPVLSRDLRTACNKLLVSDKTFGDSTRPTPSERDVDIDETIQRLLGTFKKATSVLTQKPIPVAA